MRVQRHFIYRFLTSRTKDFHTLLLWMHRLYSLFFPCFINSAETVPVRQFPTRKLKFRDVRKRSEGCWLRSQIWNLDIGRLPQEQKREVKGRVEISEGNTTRPWVLVFVGYHVCGRQHNFAAALVTKKTFWFSICSTFRIILPQSFLFTLPVTFRLHPAS